MRHPNELGGICWFATMIMNSAMCIVNAWLYSVYFEGAGKLDSAALFAVIGFVEGLWLLSLIVFLSCVNPAYLGTFVSLKTGPEHSMSYFLDSTDDQRRVRIFQHNERHWRKIKAQVSDWVEANITRWQEEKPAWFTEAVSSTIPDDMCRSPNTGPTARKNGSRKSIHALATRQHLHSVSLHVIAGKDTASKFGY